MKFDNIREVTADPIWVSLPVGDFQCVHFDPKSPTYLRAQQVAIRPVRKLVEHGELPPAKDREISITLFVNQIVKGWRHVKSDGKEVPYSAENCIALLTQDPQTFYDLIEETQAIQNFKPTPREAKNSAATSITS